VSGPPPTAWLNALLGFLQWAQHGVLALWHALGLTGDVRGQPAWPWSARIAGETLLIDLGQARQLGLTLIAVVLALVAALVALLVRRWRAVAVGASLGLLVAAPWPSPDLVLAPAVPTSFHDNPHPFSLASITHGAHVYAAACASCHGDDGRGEGPLAATLTRWPPTVVGPLLGRRADGELFWHIAHGMRNAQGAVTMPAFSLRFSDTDIWAVLDYMKVLAASGGARAGGWPLPVALPVLSVRCGDGPAQPLARWRDGQRLRLIAADAASAGRVPLEDPRLRTLLVTPDGTLPPLAARSRHAAWPRAATPGPSSPPLPGPRRRRLPARNCWPTATAGCALAARQAPRGPTPISCAPPRRARPVRRAPAASIRSLPAWTPNRCVT